MGGDRRIKGKRMDLDDIHARRASIHIPSSLGGRIADAVVSGMGSWRFILIQSAIVLCWIVGNLYLLSKPFDPYPFILLNLAFSTQAAYASPLILMAGNRGAARDRARDDIQAHEVDELVEMNKRQLEILELLHGMQNCPDIEPTAYRHRDTYPNT